MRKTIFVLLISGLFAGPASAAIWNLDECARSISVDPAKAREEAAQWYSLGGGPEARVCEALSLQALGAYGSAAQILTETATDRDASLGPAFRAALLLDAVDLWLDLGQAEIARRLIAQVEDYSGVAPRTVLQKGRASLLEGDADAAISIADRVLQSGSESQAAPAILLAGQAFAEKGNTERALQLYLRVVEIAPDSWEQEQAEAFIAQLPL